MDRGSSRAPLVSVGVPVYNGEKFIARALASVVGSDYPNLEIVVCDNASTDGTEEICRRFAADDARIRYYRNEVNIGASPNFERAFELSQGVYFRWLAHDDWCTTDYDSRCVEALEARPDAVVAFSGQSVIDQNGTVTKVNYERIDGIDDPVVTRRFKALVWSLQDPTAPVFGLMRVEALRRTLRIRNSPEPDRVLLYELCLYGGLLLVDAPLFHRYRPHGHLLHYGAGRARRRSYEWLHPANVGRLRMSAVRVLHAQISSVQRSDLSLRDKAVCTWQILSSAAVLRPGAKLRSIRRMRRLTREARTGSLVDPGQT